MALTKVKTGGLTDGSVTAAKLAAGVLTGGGTNWQSTIQTADFTAEASKGYFVNTTSGSITVTLPAGVVGEEIILQDYAGTFDTNKITITANGSEKIQGGTANKICNTENALVRLVYQDAIQGWTGDNIASESAVVNYLVIAGGGGGPSGYQAGGGGAGGYRASYNNEASGGGGSSENSIDVNIGTSYTVTVGAGGAGGPALNAITSGSYPGNGSNSVFATVTSIGGGAGASYWNGTGNNNDGDGGNKGRDGGSGGGTGLRQMNALAGGSGTTNQGYAGGGIDAVYQSPYGGGGGGGAGAVGTTITSSTLLGHGGNGVSSTITGSAVTRAGGGGGGCYDGTNIANGGSGGGGAGGKLRISASNTTATAATAGSVNTGGGAGGEGINNTAGKAGGSGIVILRYPNTRTITIGSGLTGTTATVGSDKVTTFTEGTGNIQFN